MNPFANETDTDDEQEQEEQEQEQTVPELEEYSDDEIDDLFDRLQGGK